MKVDYSKIYQNQTWMRALQCPTFTITTKTTNDIEIVQLYDSSEICYAHIQYVYQHDPLYVIKTTVSCVKGGFRKVFKMFISITF